MSEYRCWATLGAFDEKGDGRIVELDANTGTVNEIMQFEQPPQLRVVGKGFTGGSSFPSRVPGPTKGSVVKVSQGARNNTRNVTA